MGCRPRCRRTALCLYRIAQEALQNVVKHSGATRVTIELNGTGEALCLTVSDDGCGFDPQAVHNEASLGLVSMRERMRLVRGQLAIESRPGAGTRVEARAPLASHPAAPSGEGER
jgi:signal transduction histidine kinase